MLWQWIWIIQTLVSHEKNRGSLQILHLHIKMEVSKHCVVTQSVYVMQPYISL